MPTSSSFLGEGGGLTRFDAGSAVAPVSTSFSVVAGLVSGDMACPLQFRRVPYDFRRTRPNGGAQYKDRAELSFGDKIYGRMLALFVET